jgi:predicted PurR-regulated permease PerM
MVTANGDSQAYYFKRGLAVLVGILILDAIDMLVLARDFLLPVVIAFLIAITFRPAIKWLALRGMPAWATATGFAAGILLGGFLAGYMISGPVSGWIANAPEIRRTLTEKVRGISGVFEHIARLTDEIRDAATPASGELVNEVVVKEPGLPALLWIAAYPASYAVMFTGAVILSLFLMASGNLLYEKLIHIMPTLTDKKNALRIVQDIEKEVSTYLLLHSAINAGVGMAVAIAFYLIGMPSAYLWAFLAFTLNFIPYAGPISGALVSGLVSLVMFDSLGYALLAPAIYTTIITIENQFVSPYVLGRRLQLNSVAILLAVAFWGWIWGIPGVVVAVPLLVTLKVFSSHFPFLAAVGEFLGGAKSVENGSLNLEKQLD